MGEEITIRLPQGVGKLGLVGDEGDEPTESLEQLEARLREEFQQTLAQLQARHDEENQAWSQTVDAVRQAAEKLEQIEQALVEEYRAAAVQLALKIAEKVVMQELDREEVRIDPIVDEAVAQMPGRGQIEVRLNPGDLKRCRLAEDENYQARSIRFTADPSVNLGGCIVESVEGCVESTVEDSLQQAEQALKDME